LNKLFDYDKTLLRPSNQKCIIGVDEVGRGCTAGPLVVTACQLPNNHTPLDGIDDSKKLTEAKRAKLYQNILEAGINFETVFLSPAEVDRHNVYQATIIGMKRAIHKLGLDLSGVMILVDAMPITIPGAKIKPIIRGDSQSYAIAMASVIAKHERDCYMIKLSKKKGMNQYGFEQHKGYATRQHRQAVSENGEIPGIHRKSFKCT